MLLPIDVDGRVYADKKFADEEAIETFIELLGLRDYGTLTRSSLTKKRLRRDVCRTVRRIAGPDKKFADEEAIETWGASERTAVQQV